MPPERRIEPRPQLDFELVLVVVETEPPEPLQHAFERRAPVEQAAEEPQRLSYLRQAPLETTVENEWVSHMLWSQGPQEATPEAIHARELARRFVVGKRLTFTGENGSATYELVDWDDHVCLLRRVEVTGDVT